MPRRPPREAAALSKPLAGSALVARCPTPARVALPRDGSPPGPRTRRRTSRGCTRNPSRGRAPSLPTRSPGRPRRLRSCCDRRRHQWRCDAHARRSLLSPRRAPRPMLPLSCLTIRARTPHSRR
eukprot:784518-Prymnesium_polylepis.1